MSPRRKPPQDPPAAAVQPGQREESNVVPITGPRPKAERPATGKGSRKPYKLTASKVEEYLDELRAGRRRSIAASNIGLSRSTIAERRRSDPAFAKAEAEAESVANELIEDALFEAAVNGNTTAIQVWLYNRSPERWRDQRGAVDRAAAEAGSLSELSDEERAARLKAARDEADKRLKAAGRKG